jgi:cellobiose phosphorylase
MSRFESKYGYFDEAAREYVITSPHTPRPWVNVICPGDWGVIVSQTGGGYSWRGHASLNAITRWSQDMIRDSWGKYVYVRDDATGEIWSLAWMPVKRNPERYAVRHGLGYSVIESSTMGISSKLTIAVPPGEPLEVWLVELVNEGSVDRELSLFTYFEWCLGVSPDWHREFHRTFIETSIEPEISTIWAQKRLWEIPNDKGTPWNRSWEYTAFHASSLDASGFECDKERILGMYGDKSKPVAVERGYLSNSCGRWTDAIGSIHVRVKIPAGDSRQVSFVLGAVEAGHESEARTLISRYRDANEAAAALRRVSQFWSGLLEPHRVQTPDEAFNLMQNTWLPYQAISCRLWGRTGYYQPGGAYGFRDQLQDSQIFLPLDPSQTAKQIKLHAAHQYVDGHVDHWWHPISERGGGGLYSDDLLWLPYVTTGYLKETGDYALLDEGIPYRDGDSESLWMHCIRAIELSLSRRSERGLPLILDGDWNDGMNAVGADRRGESIWVAEFLCTILPDIAHLARLRGDSDLATRYEKECRSLADAVNTYGWSADGGWYIRAVCDGGTPIGDPKCRYGKVFLNPQVWAIISGIATGDRAKSAWRAVVEHLSTDAGPVLFAPAYAEPDERIGYLTRYAPGVRENGGRYTHAAAWAIVAAVMVGDSSEAWRMYHRVCPVRCGCSPDVYKVEPYVTPGNVDGPDSRRYREGGWTWYTGSAAWLFRVGSEWLLGIRPEWDGLRVDPCIPANWDEFHVKRRFRNATYEISVRNPRHVSSGVSKMTLDGGEVEGNLLPALGDGKAHVVEVTLG